MSTAAPLVRDGWLPWGQRSGGQSKTDRSVGAQ
jgi:hypothetical protein